MGFFSRLFGKEPASKAGAGANIKVDSSAGDGPERFYQTIADGIVNAIPDDAWHKAWMEVTFFPRSTDYSGWYLIEADGEPISFLTDSKSDRAFEEMRTWFQNAGKPLWCRARFELFATGKFDVKFDYDGDKDGFAEVEGEDGEDRADDPPEFRTLIEQCMEELRVKTAAHDASWHLGEIARWSVDQDAGTIVFACPNGITATCPVQIVGTYNTEDGTWLWGWDHPSVQPAVGEHARKVKAYGEENGIPRLITRKLNCTEDEAWEFTALACKLGDAQGAFRGPSGPTRVFMTFGTVTLQKQAGDARNE
jgi:hypothetical protein